MEHNITAEKLGVDSLAFKVAIDKLQNEGLINGANFIYVDNSFMPIEVITGSIKMTMPGISYVENKFEIDKTLNGIEKVKKVAEKGLKWGWEQLKDIAARTLAEIAYKSINK